MQTSGYRQKRPFFFDIANDIGSPSVNLSYGNSKEDLTFPKNKKIYRNIQSDIEFRHTLNEQRKRREENYEARKNSTKNKGLFHPDFNRNNIDWLFRISFNESGNRTQLETRY